MDTFFNLTLTLCVGSWLCWYRTFFKMILKFLTTLYIIVIFLRIFNFENLYCCWVLQKIQERTLINNRSTYNWRGYLGLGNLYKCNKLINVLINNFFQFLDAERKRSSKFIHSIRMMNWNPWRTNGIQTTEISLNHWV